MLPSFLDDAFFADIWQKRTARQPCGAQISELLTFADLEELLYSLPRLDPDWVCLVRNGRILPGEDLVGSNALICLEKVYAAYERGYTIQLAKVERRSQRTAAFCRALDHRWLQAGVLMRRPISAHVYATPPGHQGLPPHYDDHDVLVLQLAGTKSWSLHGPARESVARQTALLDDVPEVAERFTLSPGEVLYIPRGWIHQATADQHSSLHLSLSIYTHTWADIVFALLQKQPAFQRSPLGAEASELKELLASVPAPEVERVTAELRNQTEQMLEYLPKGGLEYIGNTAACDIERRPLRPRPGARIRFDTTSTGVALQAGQARVEAPPAFRSVFEYVAQADAFHLRDLPGNLTHAQLVNVCRELVTSGLLVV